MRECDGNGLGMLCEVSQGLHAQGGGSESLFSGPMMLMRMFGRHGETFGTFRLSTVAATVARKTTRMQPVEEIGPLCRSPQISGLFERSREDRTVLFRRFRGWPRHWRESGLMGFEGPGRTPLLD